MKKSIALVVFLLGIFIVPSMAQSNVAAVVAPVKSQFVVPERMAEGQLVNDYIGLFTQEQVNVLEGVLQNFYASTFVPIAVVLTDENINSSNGFDAAAQIRMDWKLGITDEYDRGIVILLKPNSAGTQDGNVSIAVGPELEANVISQEILDEILQVCIITHCSLDRYFDGVAAAAFEFIRHVVLALG